MRNCTISDDDGLNCNVCGFDPEANAEAGEGESVSGKELHDELIFVRQE